MAKLISPTQPTSGWPDCNSEKVRKPGEFTGLAEDYSKYRPDYCPSVLNGLLGLIEVPVSEVEFVDVGAGTGIWSRMVYDKGVKSVTAVGTQR